MKSLIYDNQLEYKEIKQETLQLVEKKVDSLTEAIIIERKVESYNSMKYPGLGAELIP